MALSKDRVYYKAVRRAVTAVTSAVTLREKLGAIIRNTARAMDCGASLVLLDSTGKQLAHTASWALPQFYLRKGLLSAEKSLAEVVTKQPVIVNDVGQDSRIQYPEVAARAGITAMLGVPVLEGGHAIGSIRAYARQATPFTNQDVTFVTTMANLAALALSQGEPGLVETGPGAPVTPGESAPLRLARDVTFANPSEAEFAHILDFYNIEWVYEPKSFPLRWEGGHITEMFTPDFYLPALDLYIEITVMKQNLTTDKHRKLRHLRELYPDVKIMLLHKGEYDFLLAKYGYGPLAHTRARGIRRVLFSPAEIEERVHAIADEITRDYAGKRPVLVGVQRGFICFMADLIRHITIPLDVDFLTISYYSGSSHSVRITKDADINLAGRDVIVIQGIVDTGMTLAAILDHLRPRGTASLAVASLLDKRVRRIADVPLRYVGFEVQDEFVVGYGLDYREEYRNLPFIGVPRLEKSPEEAKAESVKTA